MRKVRDERCHTYETNPLNVKSVVLIKVGLQIAFTSARSQHSSIRRALSALIKHGDYPRKWRNNHE